MGDERTTTVDGLPMLELGINSPVDSGPDGDRVERFEDGMPKLNIAGPSGPEQYRHYAQMEVSESVAEKLIDAKKPLYRVDNGQPVKPGLLSDYRLADHEYRDYRDHELQGDHTGASFRNVQAQKATFRTNGDPENPGPGSLRDTSWEGANLEGATVFAMDVAGMDVRKAKNVRHLDLTRATNVEKLICTPKQAEQMFYPPGAQPTIKE